MTELTLHEQHEVTGGDWWERYMEITIGAALFGGMFATPGLLVISAIGGSMLFGNSGGWNWF